MKKAFFLIFTLIVFCRFSIAQNCNCKLNFEWLKETFENNDAGFKYVLEIKGKEAYNHHNNLILNKLEGIKTYQDCQSIMKEWLRFFRPFHLSINFTDSIQQLSDSVGRTEYQQAFKDIAKSTIDNHEKISISPLQWIKYLNNIRESGFEGIWQFPPRYTFGIIRQGKGYTGFILEGPKKVPLQKGSVNLKIYPSPKGYLATVYGSDLSHQDSAVVQLRDNRYMNVGNYYFEKISPIYPESKQKQAYYNNLESDVPVFQLLSSKTAYIRLPSFALNQKVLIDSVLNANDARIKSIPNLIIDIRNNGGGTDLSYQGLTRYIYTNPIRLMPVFFYSSPLNNQIFTNKLKRTDLGGTERLYLEKLTVRLNNNLGQYVPLDSNKVEIVNMPEILPNPQSVAIMVNGNTGSSAEQMVVDFRQSKKVKVFGQSTLGSLDFSNLNTAVSPQNEFILMYATTSSSRIPTYSVDATGVQPDYFIDDSFSEVDAVNYTKDILEAGHPGN